MDAVAWVFAEQLHISPLHIPRLRYRLFTSFETRVWQAHFEALRVKTNG